MKAAELRDLGVDELGAKERDLTDQLFRMRIQQSMGQLEAPDRLRTVRRDLARVKTFLKTESSRRRNSAGKKQWLRKSEKVGVVVSNKMQKSIVVAVEWQVRARAVRQDHAAHVEVHGARREGRRPASATPSPSSKRGR